MYLLYVSSARLEKNLCALCSLREAKNSKL